MDLKTLQTFCSESARYNTATPFTIGEWTYATDLRVVIRVPKVAGVIEAAGKLTTKPYPPVGKIQIDQFSVSTALPPLPEIPFRCPECRDGAGIRCHSASGAPYRVKATKCFYCKGRTTPDETPVQFGSGFYDRKYLRLITALGKGVVCAEVEYEKKIILSFRQNDLCGMLISLTIPPFGQATSVPRETTLDRKAGQRSSEEETTLGSANSTS